MKLLARIQSVSAVLLLSVQLASAAIPAQYANNPVILQIEAMLAEGGYEIIEVKKTFLGRFKIEAIAPGFEREIVVAAGGGTILRDHRRKIGPAESATEQRTAPDTETDSYNDGPDAEAGEQGEDSSEGDAENGADEGAQEGQDEGAGSDDTEDESDNH